MIYVLQIQSGKEPEVCTSLKRIGIKVYAPCERIIIRRGGLWTKMLKLLFPGYVFTDIEYSAEMFHKIKPISGVIRFLGSPTPLPEHEAEMINWLANGGDIIEPSEAVIGENGSIIGFKGFLNGCEDKIRYINKRQKKALIAVRFDGKLHKANISFDFPDNKQTEE